MKGWTRMNVEKSNPSICSHFTWLVVIIYCSGCSESLGSWLPQLGGATLAILLGIVLGNTFFNQNSMRKERNLQKVGF